MNKPLTLGSLFDGSGGFPLAGLLSGIVPVWSSEIEPFAIRVTEKRLPQVQHFGNISGLHGAKLVGEEFATARTFLMVLSKTSLKNWDRSSMPARCTRSEEMPATRSRRQSEENGCWNPMKWRKSKHDKSNQQKGYKTTGGNDFSDTAIHTILTNQKYKGTYTYDRTAAKDSEGHRNSHKIKPDPIEIPDGMPAIIEPALFDKVQEKLAQNRRRTASRTGKNYYALNGFTRCPKCGKPFSGNVNHSNGHKYLQYRRSCDCGIPSVRADQLVPFVFHAVKNCLFQPANQPKIIEAVNQKLSLRKLMQSGETNTIQNRINGLEKANANLMAYLEQGRATETILRSVEKNEQELQQLKQQLDALDNPISAVDDATYREIVQKFTNYMCTEKSPEAAALKEAVLRDIQIGKETITVNFQHGVFIDEETKAYFNDNRKELAS